MNGFFRRIFGSNDPEEFVPITKTYNPRPKKGILKGKTVLWLESSPEIVNTSNYNTAIQENAGTVIVSNSIGYGMEKIARNEVDFAVLELILLRDPWSKEHLEKDLWYIGNKLPVYQDLQMMECAGDIERYRNLADFARERIESSATPLAGLDFIKYLRENRLTIPCGVVSVVDQPHIIPEKLEPLELSFYFTKGRGVTPKNISDAISSSIEFCMRLS